MNLTLSQGASWRLVGLTILSVSSYATMVVLAREFGPGVYGVYGIVYAVLMSIEMMLRFGLPQAVTRSLGANSKDSNSSATNGFVLLVGANTVAFGVLWIAAPFLTGVLNIEDGTRFMRIAIIDLPFYSAYAILNAVLAGRFNFKWNCIATCVYGLSRLVGVVALAVADALTIENALIVNVMASVCGCLVAALRIGASWIRPSATEMQQLIGAAIPIYMSEVGMVLLMSIDLWALSALAVDLESEFKGLYVAALSLARAPNMLGYVLASVLIPVLSRTLAAREREDAGRVVVDTNRLLLAILLPACGVAVANSADLLELLYSSAYREGAEVMPLLLLGHGVLATMLLTLIAMLVGGGRSANGASRVVMGLVIAAVASVLLVPSMTWHGAAIVPVLSFGFATMLVAREVRKCFGALVEPLDVVKTLSITALLCLVSYLWQAKGIWLVFELAMISVAYCGIAVTFGLFRLDSKSRAADASPSVSGPESPAGTTVQRMEN